MKKAPAYVMVFVLISVFKLNSQHRNVDSLKALLLKDKDDTVSVTRLMLLANEYINRAPDKAVNYCKKAVSLSEKAGWQKGIAESNSFLGRVYLRVPNFQLALKYFETALAEWKKYETYLYVNNSQNKKELEFVQGETGGLLAAMGSACMDIGEYNKAVDYFLRSYKISEKTKNKNTGAENLVRLGIVYSEMNDFTKSLQYYLRSLTVFEELGNKNREALTLGNIGNIYYIQGNYKRAGEYYLQTLKLHTEMGDKEGINYVLGYMGGLYFAEAGVLQKAGKAGGDSLLKRSIAYYTEALKISEERGDKKLAAVWLGSIGQVYVQGKNYAKAEEYLSKAVKTTGEMGLLNEQMQFESSLCELYTLKNDHKSAYMHFNKYISIKDSLFNTAKKEQIVRHELNYEFEKKEDTAKAEQEKKDAVAEIESKKQKLILWLVCGALLLVVLFVLFISRALGITRKQKTIIELKNREAEAQKQIIELKNKDIIDSILYAKRIQQSLLPTERYIERHLNKWKKG